MSQGRLSFEGVDDDHDVADGVRDNVASVSYVLEGVDDDDDVDIFYGVGDELAQALFRGG